MIDGVPLVRRSATLLLDAGLDNGIRCEHPTRILLDGWRDASGGSVLRDVVCRSAGIEAHWFAVRVDGFDGGWDDAPCVFKEGLWRRRVHC